MSFEIKYVQQGSTWGGVTTFEWVGCFAPKPFPAPSQIICITATKEELQFIRKNFLNIPFIDKESVTWRGSLAQFIYENLQP